MTTALEVELKQYAHNLVADHVKYEYDRQIGLWQQHINLMVDAQTEAINRHQKVLDEARQQVEKEREANFALAMLALSALAGPVLSWVAGKIQYKWYPKVASKSKDRLVFLAEQDSPWGKYYHMIDKDHDKVWAKVFGDLGKQAAGWGIDKALKVVTPQSGAAMNAVESAAASDRGSFKSRLENAMLEQSRRTSDAIMSVAMSINENSDYGAECLQRLKRNNARARDPKVPEKELEALAKQ